MNKFERMINQGIDAIFLTPVDWEDDYTPALEDIERSRCENYQ